MNAQGEGVMGDYSVPCCFDHDRFDDCCNWFAGAHVRCAPVGLGPPGEVMSAMLF